MISHQPGSSSSIPRRFGVRPGPGRNVGRNPGEKPGENVGKHRENLGKHGENTSKPGILMRIWEDDRFLIDRLLPFWGGMSYFWAKSEPWSHLGWKEVLSVTHAISRFFWDIHLDFRRTFCTFCNTLFDPSSPPEMISIFLDPEVGMLVSFWPSYLSVDQLQSCWQPVPVQMGWRAKNGWFACYPVLLWCISIHFPELAEGTICRNAYDYW